MTVKELIALLQTTPQDALVTQTLFSDYKELEPGDISVMDGPRPDGSGLIRHHGHLMWMHGNWWPKHEGEKPAKPEYVKAVHFNGN